MHWDQALAAKLIQLGLTREQVGAVIGEVAEQRMNADREGYARGYNNGYENATSKYHKTVSQEGE